MRPVRRYIPNSACSGNFSWMKFRTTVICRMHEDTALASQGAQTVRYSSSGRLPSLLMSSRVSLDTPEPFMLGECEVGSYSFEASIQTLNQIPFRMCRQLRRRAALLLEELAFPSSPRHDSYLIARSSLLSLENRNAESGHGYRRRTSR